MTTKGDNDIPLFEHIATKWSQKESKQQYEIAVASSLADEATRVLRGLKNYLIKEYGNEARNHFAGVKNIANKTVIMRKRNYTLFNTGWDEDISNFIKQTNNEDKLSKVLIEEMEMITNQQDKNDNKGAIIFNEATKQETGEKSKSARNDHEDDKEDAEENNEIVNEKEIIEIQDEEEHQNDGEHEDTTTDGGKYLQQKEWDDITL